MDGFPMSERWICVPDLQMPGEHKNALKFIKSVVREFRIPKDNVLFLGDEVDIFHGSQYPSGPDYGFTPSEEIQIAREKLKEWYKTFPVARVCISNHGLRWSRKAFASNIPEAIIREYHDIFQIPKSWQYQLQFLIKAKHPFMIQHGHGYSGKDGHRNAAIDNGVSTIIGHLHSFAAIDYIKTRNKEIWAVNSGSLVDENHFIFNYGKDSRNKVINGCTVILDKGKRPFFIPI